MDIKPKSPEESSAVVPDVLEKDVKHIDKAALFLASAEGTQLLSPAAEKRLKWKIDLILIPMVCAFLSFMLKQRLTSPRSFSSRRHLAQSTKWL